MVVQSLSLQAGEAIFVSLCCVARKGPTLPGSGGDVGVLVLVLVWKGTVLFHLCRPVIYLVSTEYPKICARLRKSVFSFLVCWFRF